MAENTNADDSKVMDVASPGQSKPDTGSKPMVVGHKSIMSDPTVKAETTDEKPVEEQLPSKKKLTIQPLADNEKTVEEKSADSEQKQTEEPKSEDVQAPTQETPNESTETTETSTEDSTRQDDEKSAEEQEADEEQAKLEKEAHLQEIVKSKKFYVPIKAQSSTAVKTFLITFLIVCVVGVVALAALIDAEIIDLGIDLPFDLL